MARPSTNVTIFSETPKPITALPTEVKTGGYQNNQVITAGEYNRVMSDIQKWVNYLDEERKSGLTKDATHDTEIATLKTRATSLETSRNNRMGEIITTISDHKPLDCLPCDGSDYAKSDFQDFVNYAVTKGYFADNGGEAEDMYTTGRYGKLIHGGYSATSPRFVVPNLTGMFLRMTGGIEAGRLGYYQADDLKSHYHFIANDNIVDVTYGVGTNKAVVNPSGASGGYLTAQGRLGNAPQEDYAFIFNNVEPNVLRSSNTGGSETRPKNIAVNFWIRYR